MCSRREDGSAVLERSVLSKAYPSTHSDHEGNGADHLQNEGYTQYLLPNVALETQTTHRGQEVLLSWRPWGITTQQARLRGVEGDKLTGFCTIE